MGFCSFRNNTGLLVVAVPRPPFSLQLVLTDSALTNLVHSAHPVTSCRAARHASLSFRIKPRFSNTSAPQLVKSFVLFASIIAPSPRFALCCSETMASSTSASSASASAAVDALLAPPTISAVILLDREGKRVAAKYYKDALPSAAAQLAFEKKIFARTSQRAPHDEPEVFLLDSFLVMYHGGFDRSSAPFSQLIVVVRQLRRSACLSSALPFSSSRPIDRCASFSSLRLHLLLSFLLSPLLSPSFHRQAPATENELFVQLVLSAIEAPLTSLLAPEAGRSGLDALSVIYLVVATLSALCKPLRLASASVACPNLGPFLALGSSRLDSLPALLLAGTVMPRPPRLELATPSLTDPGRGD